MSDSGQKTNDETRTPVAPILLQSEQKTPNKIGRYEIIRLLGEGAVGMVYLARDPGLNRAVALKVPTERFAEGQDDDALFHFYREAHAASTLHHPNICKIYEVGQDGDLHYIAMQFVEGRPLSDFVQPDNPLPVDQVALIISKLAEAIEQAHQQGVVHRDIRPDNIIVDANREPIVMNFGLAHKENSETDSRFTQTGMISGSPSYLAPEQVESETGNVGPATDIYSLGVVFFELLTGRPPFDGAYDDVLAQILKNDPDFPSRLRDGVHPALDNLCLQMLSKRIDQRPKSMADVSAALNEYMDRIEREVAQPKVQLTAFDQKQAVRDARSERLETYKRNIENLRKEGAYDAALRMLKQMAELQDPRFEGYSQWAREQIPLLQAEPERIRQQRMDAVEAARQLIYVNDYQSAVDILEQIPRSLRTASIAGLLDEAKRLNTRCEVLINAITEGFQRHEPKRLLPKVEKLLELRPGYEQARKWYFQLTGRQFGEEPEDSTMPPVVFWPLAGLAVAAVVAVGIWVFQHNWSSVDLPDAPRPKLAGLNDPGGKTLSADPERPAPGIAKPEQVPENPPVNAVPVAVAPEFNYGAPIDLLRLIDPQKNRIYGAWQFDNEELTCRSGKKGDVHFLQIPYGPPSEYEIRVTATRLANTEPNPALILGLVNGASKHFLAVLDQRRTDNYLLKLQNENASSENKAYYKGEVLKDDTKAEIVYRVTKNGVYISVDGQDIVDWKGDPKSLECKQDLRPPDPSQLALKCHASHRISRMELRPINPGAAQPQPQVQTVDLLKLIDLQKHVYAGSWQRNGDELISLAQEAGRKIPHCSVQIPYVPPEEYELRVVATMKLPADSNPALMLGIIGAGRHFQAVLNQRKREYGLYRLDGVLLLRRNKSFRAGPAFRADQPTTIICRVTKAGVNIAIDGRVVIDWTGAFSRLEVAREHVPPNLQQLALKCVGNYQFHKIELGPIGNLSPATPQQPVAQQPQKKFDPLKYPTSVDKSVNSVWQVSTSNGMRREIFYDDGATENGQKWTLDGNSFSFGYDSGGSFIDNGFHVRGRWQRGALYSARLQSRKFYLNTAETKSISIPSGYGTSEYPTDKQGMWNKSILDLWEFAAITNKKDKLIRRTVAILADGRVVDGLNRVGDWKLDANDQLTVTFVDDRLGEVTFTPKSSRQLTAEKRGAEDWKFRLDRVQQVATVLFDSIGSLTFYSNGRIRHPSEGAPWIFRGNNRNVIATNGGDVTIGRDGQTARLKKFYGGELSGRLISGSFRRR